MDDFGPSCVCSSAGCGREGKDGPDKGECCLKGGEAECKGDDVVAEDNVEDLNGCNMLILGLRIGDALPAGDEPTEGRSLAPPALAALSLLNRETN
jgi:hypothetical protein